MLKRRREADTAADTAELDPVFVDTNLGTHLAVLLCNSDTASDFKKKVATEHKKCFPEIGEIEVHSVMVKRRSNFYHLPDIMHVKSAFHGVKCNRFLSVDASKSSSCLAIRNSLEHGAGSDVRNAVAEPLTEKPLEKITDSHSSPYPEEHHVETKSPAKKKRKLRHNSSLEDSNAVVRPNGIDEKPNIPDVKVLGERNDQYDVKGRHVSEGTSLPSMEEKFNVDSILNSQNLTSTNRTEEGNTFESMVDSGLGKDVLPLGAVSITALESSARMMNAGGGGGDVSTTGSKRKKRGVKKTTAKISDTTDTEQIGKEESIKPSTVEMEEVKGLLSENDDEVIMSSNSKSPDHVGPDLALKEASHLQDAEKSNFSIVNSYKLKDSDETKEDNVVECKVDYELDQYVPTVHSSGICTNTADLSATKVDAGGGNGDVNSDGKKRKKKKKAQKSAKVKDTRDMEHIGEDEVKKPETETIRSEEKDVSLKHDKVILPSESNYPDHVDPDLTQKEARVMRDSDAVMEPEISNCTKKKRKRKRDGTNAENLGIKEIHKDIGGSLDLPSPSGYNISKATGKDENIRLNEGMDVEMKLLDSSGHDAQEKVWESNRKAADPLQTQTEHTLENVTVGNKMMTRKTSSSVGDCHADSCTAETEYTIMESNKVDKDNENTKKKKRRSIGIKKEKLGVVEIHKVIGGSLDVPSPSHDHIPLATGKDESIRINEGNNARKELLDASNHAAEENILEVNRKEADSVESQTLENVSVLNKMMTDKTQSSAGNRHADFSTAEPENPIMEFTQMNKDDENGESKHKKPTKKRRKQKNTATVVPENLPVKDQQVGIEALATKEPSEKSELEGRYVDASQVLSCRNEEKVDEMHELVPNTNGLKENSEKGSEGINFRQYIVADQLQNKADYSDMVRTGAKARSSRIADTDGVPSANIPINLQNSVKSFENKISENNPYREDTLRTKCDSAHNSDQDETSPNSVRRSLKTTEKQENGRSVLGPKVSGKPSSCKTSSGRSETLHNRRGNALLGRKISNMMRMKTPKKKISLAKPGGIFQDNSGESSEEDNGTMLSEDRTISPSDSSSMSGNSEGESELSQNSASNGSTGAKAKSFSMFDFSASTEVAMTMDHLKCSDLFKKSMKVAKPIEPIQFDPDGQPI